MEGIDGGLVDWLVKVFRVLVVLGFRVPWRAPDPRHSSWCPEKTPRSCNASSEDPPIRDPALSWKHKPPLTTIAIRLHRRPREKRDLLLCLSPLRVRVIERQWKISVRNLKRYWNNQVLRSIKDTELMESDRFESPGDRKSLDRRRATYTHHEVANIKIKYYSM